MASQSQTVVCEEWVENPLIKHYKTSNTVLFWEISKKGVEMKKQDDLVHEYYNYINRYEKALKIMSDASGIKDYDEMVKTMIEFEDANFASVQRISSIE